MQSRLYPCPNRRVGARLSGHRTLTAYCSHNKKMSVGYRAPCGSVPRRNACRHKLHGGIRHIAVGVHGLLMEFISDTFCCNPQYFSSLFIGIKKSFQLRSRNVLISIATDINANTVKIFFFIKPLIYNSK